MTTAHKDLPALPEGMQFLGPKGWTVVYTADHMHAYVLADRAARGDCRKYCQREADEAAALARPEPASTPVAVMSIDDTAEFRPLAMTYAKALINGSVPDAHKSFKWLVAHIDAHVAAQVEKGQQASYKGGFDSGYSLGLIENAAALKAAPQGQQSAASGDASLWPCGDCGKSVKEACSNLPCGYRAMQQQANHAAKADPAQEAGRDAVLEEAAEACGKVAASDIGFEGTAAALDCVQAVRALKTAPAQPAVDLVAAILALPDLDLFDPDVSYDSFEKGLYYRGARDMRNAAANLARAQLEGK